VSIASVQEIQARFGTSTPRRQFLFQQFQNLFHRLRAVGSVKQVFLFGSFVTGKASPNDIDLLVVMNGAFSTTNLSGQDLDIFQHDLCRIRFDADVFWVTEAVGADRIEDLLDVFSRNRDGQPQPIVEVQL
jgi:predicted nucleotidyltransferase